MIDILSIIETGKTKRLHTHDVIKEQNIAEHSWGVAVILMEITFLDKYCLTSNLLSHALLHDCAESIIGDIPYFSKKSIGKIIDDIEHDANVELGIKNHLEPLNELEKLLLDICDLLELGFKCFKEYKLGNTSLLEISKTVYNLVEKLSDNKIIPRSIRYRILTFNKRLYE